MRTNCLRAHLGVAFLGLAGCLTQVAPDPKLRHLQVGWVEDFEKARRVALERGEPILLLLVAGEIRERS